MRILLIVGLLLPAGLSFADWQSIGPEGGQIYCGVVPAGGAAVYVASTATNTPVYSTTNGGASWAPAGAALGNYPWVMAAHPTDPNTLYGAVSTIFYRTTNGGTNWSQYSFGSNTIGYDIAVNPLNPQVIYAGGYKYDGSAWRMSASKSTDGGATWTATQLDTATPAYGYSCALDPLDTTKVYVGGYAGSTTAFYRSTDCGVTWTRVTWPENAYYVYSIYASPTSPNTVFAGTLYGVWRSTDAGQTWTKQSTCNYNYRIVSVPGQPSVMYSACLSNVYKSTDSGLTWAAVGAGLFGTTIRTVLTVPGSNSTVYAGSTAGMFKSTDYGATWTAVNSGILIGKIPALSFVPNAPGSAWAEFMDNAIFVTTNDGNSWSRQTSPLSCGNLCNIVFDPSDPQRVWMFEAGG